MQKLKQPGFILPYSADSSMVDPGQQPQQSQAMLSPKGSVLQSTFENPKKDASPSKTFDNRVNNNLNYGTSLLDDDNFEDKMYKEVINP